MFGKRNWDKLAGDPTSQEPEKTNKDKSRALLYMLAAALGGGGVIYDLYDRFSQKNEKENTVEMTPTQTELRDIFLDKDAEISPDTLLDYYLKIQEERFNLTPEEVADHQAMIEAKIAEYEAKKQEGMGDYELMTEILRDIDDRYDSDADDIHYFLVPEYDRGNCIAMYQYTVGIGSILYPDLDPEMQFFSGQSTGDDAHIRALGTIGGDRYKLEGEHPIPLDYEQHVRGTYILTADSLLRIYAGLPPKVVMEPAVKVQEKKEEGAISVSSSGVFGFPQDMNTRPYVSESDTVADAQEETTQISRQELFDYVEATIKKHGQLNLDRFGSFADRKIVLERFGMRDDIHTIGFSHPDQEMIQEALSIMKKNESIHTMLVFHADFVKHLSIYDEILGAGIVIELVDANMHMKRLSLDEDGYIKVDDIEIEILDNGSRLIRKE